MTHADDSDFWDRQERLGRVAEIIEAISDADRDFGSVAIDAKRNLIRVFRRVRDMDRDVAESVYREVVPADVGLEFRASLLTAESSRRSWIPSSASPGG